MVERATRDEESGHAVEDEEDEEEDEDEMCATLSFDSVGGGAESRTLI